MGSHLLVIVEEELSLGAVYSTVKLQRISSWSPAVENTCLLLTVAPLPRTARETSSGSIQASPSCNVPVGAKGETLSLSQSSLNIADKSLTRTCAFQVREVC